MAEQLSLCESGSRIDVSFFPRRRETFFRVAVCIVPTAHRACTQFSPLGKRNCKDRYRPPGIYILIGECQPAGQKPASRTRVGFLSLVRPYSPSPISQTAVGGGKCRPPLVWRSGGGRRKTSAKSSGGEMNTEVGVERVVGGGEKDGKKGGKVPSFFSMERPLFSLNCGSDLGCT